jgi:hypothetical protein
MCFCAERLAVYLCHIIFEHEYGYMTPIKHDGYEFFLDNISVTIHGILLLT